MDETRRPVTPPGSRASARARPGTGRLLASMVAFLLVGTPMAAYLWSTLNDLLAGEIAPGRIAIAVPVLLLFVGFLVLLAGRVQRWESGRSRRGVTGGPRGARSHPRGWRAASASRRRR